MAYVILIQIEDIPFISLVCFILLLITYVVEQVVTQW